VPIRGAPDAHGSNGNFWKYYTGCFIFSRGYSCGHKKRKAIFVIRRGGPKDCETSRLPHFLDNWLTDGGEVVTLTRQPTLIPRKHAVMYLAEALCHKPKGRVFDSQ
jgi:hypothetical protein